MMIHATDWTLLHPTMPSTDSHRVQRCEDALEEETIIRKQVRNQIEASENGVHASSNEHVDLFLTRTQKTTLRTWAARMLRTS